VWSQPRCKKSCSTFCRAHGVRLRNLRLDLMLGSLVKQPISMRRPSSAQPWRATSSLRIASSVIPSRVAGAPAAAPAAGETGVESVAKSSPLERHDYSWRHRNGPALHRNGSAMAGSAPAGSRAAHCLLEDQSSFAPSIPSSWILRVMVLRPMPRRTAASFLRPWV
jgi:hypothetical protein